MKNVWLRRLVSALLGSSAVFAVCSYASPYQGFGTDTVGGNGDPVYVVTSSADSGAGTLRDALSQSNRMIKFAVTEPIVLHSPIKMTELHNVTIDGSSDPGLEIVDNGLYFYSSHDVIIHDVRIRKAAYYGVLITASTNPAITTPSYHFVIDHCSITDASQATPIDQDGKDVDITNGTHDVTISWSLLGFTGEVGAAPKTKTMLIAYFAPYQPVYNISLHHNLFYHGYQRNPQISTPGLYDFRNNIVAGWYAYGMRVRQGAYGNIVGNLFIPAQNKPQEALVLVKGESESNDAGTTFVDDTQGIYHVPTDKLAVAVYAAPHVDTYASGELRSADVLDNIGALPQDKTDQTMIESLK